MRMAAMANDASILVEEARRPVYPKVFSPLEEVEGHISVWRRRACSPAREMTSSRGSLRSDEFELQASTGAGGRGAHVSTAVDRYYNTARLVLNKERGVPALSRGWRTPDPSPSRDAAKLPCCAPPSPRLSFPSEPQEAAQTVSTPGPNEQRSSVCEDTRGLRLSSSDSQTSSMDSDSVSQVVFSVPERGLPALRRGWRTPDPSPSREAAKLPGCGPPSPLLRCEQEQGVESAEAIVDIDEKLDMVPPAVDSEEEFDMVPPPPQPFGPSSVAKVGFAGLGAEQAAMVYFTADGGAYHPTPHGALLTPVGFVGHDLCQASLVPYSMMPVGAECREDCGAPEVCCNPPSVGSIGHPYTCAEFCKYAKKARGCKDGADCNRCHLCTAKRQPETPNPAKLHHRRRPWRRPRQAE